ncbi:helix-turn-helix domain-containing protein [Streptacidiphilus sp. EB103A]|uniref:helix-turn-helix domain-containing protein n=1 Tax=Streptacidiphilus sp. EB103A TaxID=3156275 RepID=UPI003513882B
MPRPKPRPVTEADRTEILRRHGAGESRNAIARAVGRSGETVSKVVAAKGLTFERGPEVAAATEAKLTDLAARRAKLALDLQSDAERLREQLWKPAKVYAFGGKENTYEQVIHPEPPFSDKRAIMSTVATAVDRSLKLEPVKDENGADAVGSLLGGLLDRLRADHGDG